MSGVAVGVNGLTAVLAGGAMALDHGLGWRWQRWTDPSVYRGATDRLSMALTFDDGPGPQTRQLLALLQRHAIPATFFQCGLLAERYPEITREVHEAGHEIANHGYSHIALRPELGRQGLHLPTLGTMRRELAQTQQVLTNICGTPPRLFRAPYGKRWTGLDFVRRRQGLVAVQWTVIGHDWEWPAERIAAHVLPRIVPGAIVCLHDGLNVQPTANITELLGALRLMLPILRDRGYSFETVSDLLLPRPSVRAATA